jgi:hypothetical protein
MEGYFNRMEMIDVIFETKLRNQAFNKICPPMEQENEKNNGLFNYSFLLMSSFLVVIIQYL